MSFYEAMKTITQPKVAAGMDSIQSYDEINLVKQSLGKTPSRSIDSSFPAAVEVRGATYTYGSGKKAHQALAGLDLTVPEGEIYGLLGPSGCGKTTLIRSIIGRNTLDAGTIKIFGHAPGTPESYVPGPVIGYMPQEIALFDDFTIAETMYYFGKLYRIKKRLIKERMKFLLKFLDLPTKHRMVGNLSGGQKRRVSLAASLIHSPPILILDEPTVGVDPVLRQTIWDHLVHLSKTEGLTVIITTHYIEEARAANVCGFMRYGRLLIEASPDYLLSRFKMPTLEEIFLKLCMTDASEAQTRSILDSSPDTQSVDLKSVDTGYEQEQDKPDLFKNTPVSMDGTVIVEETPARQGKESYNNNKAMIPSFSPFKNQPHRQPYEIKGVKTKLSTDSLSTQVSKKVEPGSECQRTMSRIAALFKKNVIRIRRNLAMLLFNFLLPSIEIILFAVSIGRDPFDLDVAVYNGDAKGPFSKGFLSHIDNHTIVQHRYDTREQALEAVRLGQCWGAMTIPGNFSTALQQRMFSGPDVDQGVLNASKVGLHLDMSNYLIGLKLQRTLLENFEHYAQHMLQVMGLSPALAELPIVFEDPIYGVREPTFTEFMAPGVVLSIGFLAAVALTSLALIQERKEGLLDRSLVAGVKAWEFLLSHLMTSFLVMTVQVALLLVFTFAVFRIPFYGPLFWIIVMTLLQSFCGMSFGLLISSLTTDESAATMLALGSFYPNLLLSGTVWPTQGMPTGLRWFSYFLPQTLSIESMRYMVSRGWGIHHGPVGLGFGVTIAWTAIFITLAMIIFRFKL